MTNRREWFKEYDELSPPMHIKLADGRIMFAHGRGPIDVFAHDGFKWNEKTLMDVLYAPNVYIVIYFLAHILLIRVSN